jgi:hypothetical protein
MIFLQTGMVKQSVDYSASIKALDGTIIWKTKSLFGHIFFYSKFYQIFIFFFKI